MYGNWIGSEHERVGDYLVRKSGSHVADFAAFGLSPTWSRNIDVPSHDGEIHRWHVLDRPARKHGAPVVLCLHGNPTWSFVWSRLLQELSSDFRVIAPDLLSMGFSDRVSTRVYSDRVGDVADLLQALGVDLPVWIVAQDWGGAIAMGFAVQHPNRVAGMVLSNTGIAVPDGRRAPWLIRAAAATGINALVTRYTSLFMRGTPLLPGKGLTKEQKKALILPYRSSSARKGVSDFVADVPLTNKHSSAADIADVAAKLGSLTCPVRLLWGVRDPVFNDDFAHDLMRRFNNVALHCIKDAGHLAILESSIAPLVETAIREIESAPEYVPVKESEIAPETLWSQIDTWESASDIAICDAANKKSVTRPEFAERVATFAEGLHVHGARRGDRVAVLIPPSIDLIAVVYACWRIGAVAVIADRGLGLRQLGKAVRSARVQHVIGSRRAIYAARVLRWAPTALMINLSGSVTAHQVRCVGQVGAPEPEADDPAAVLFTSGATGPAKGVCYTHRQLYAQRDALQRTYNISTTDRLVAAFAPFALYGPALGIATGLADMDVTSPSTLTARALDDACGLVGATMVFASPAALSNVVRTATAPLPHLANVRLMMSAGAPVPVKTLEEIAILCPGAQIHTPYGMTEILPVTDVCLNELTKIGFGRGVCVGHPVVGSQVVIAGTDNNDSKTLAPVGVTGEVLVSSPWMSSGYDSLWHTQYLARPTMCVDGTTQIWHRTGDVGHYDIDGNLWIEGRVVHLIHTDTGTVTPVPLEIAVEALPAVLRAAAVGVGAHGTQQVVIVVETANHSDGPADAELTASVRAAVSPQAVAAVWLSKKLPVDIRHNSKIDRTAVGVYMSEILAGAKR